MGLRSSRLVDYEEAIERLGSVVTQFEAGYNRLVMVEVPVKNRRDGDLFRHTLKYNAFYDMFITPVFPSMPDAIVQRLFSGLANGGTSLGLKDFVSGIAVIVKGTTAQRAELLSRCYDPKGSSYIPLKTLKRVAHEVDPARRHDEASGQFIKAAVQRCGGYSGYDEISVKDFQDLACRDAHAHAPVISWLRKFGHTLEIASKRGGYRYGTLINKESTLAVLHKATRFTQPQIESLNTAAKHVRMRHSSSGFLDGKALLSLLGPPSGVVPPLVLQQLMRQLDTTNTGTLSLRELVEGLARLGFDQASMQNVDMSRKFIFDLFADCTPDPLVEVEESSRTTDNGQGVGLSSRHSLPRIHKRITKGAFREMLIAFGVGTATGGAGSMADDPAAPSSSGSMLTQSAIQRQVSLEDIVIDDVDDAVVDVLVAGAPFPSNHSNPRHTSIVSSEGNGRTAQSDVDHKQELDYIDLAAFEQWEENVGRPTVPMLRRAWTVVFVELLVRPTDPKMERAVIDDCCGMGSEVFDPRDPGELGMVWHLIPTGWWAAWRKYTDPSTTRPVPPGPINNDVFSLPPPATSGKETFVRPRSDHKRPNLKRGRDYELVNSRTFHAFNAWYCGGRCRDVSVVVVPAFSGNAPHGCDREVELYKLRLTVIEAGTPRRKKSRDSPSKHNKNGAMPMAPNGLYQPDPQNPPRPFSRRMTLRQFQVRAKQYYRYCASAKVPLAKTRILLRVLVDPNGPNGPNGASNSAGHLTTALTHEATVPTSNGNRNNSNSGSGAGQLIEQWVPLDGDELTLADLGIQDMSVLMLDFKVVADEEESGNGKNSGKKSTANGTANGAKSDDSNQNGGTKDGCTAKDGHGEGRHSCDEDDDVWMYDVIRQREAERLAKRKKGEPGNPSQDTAVVATTAALKQTKKRRFFSRAYKHNVVGVVGLKNMGNTCYMNASLQCLAACRLLREYLLDERLYSHDLNTSPNAHRLGMGGKLAVAFAELMQDMWSGANAGAAIAPKSFKKTIGQFNRRFRGYQQQDAQELISTLLGALHEDLNRVKDKPYNEQPDSNNRSDEVVAMEWWRNHLRRDLSVITALFTGQFKSSLTCQKCQYESSRFEPFSFLPIPLPENPKRYQRVMLYGHGLVPLELSLSVETNSTVKHVLGELQRILCEDYQRHKSYYDALPPGHAPPAATGHKRKDSRRYSYFSRDQRGKPQEDEEPLGFGNVLLKDLLPVIIDHYTVGDVLPITSSLSGFDYGNSVIHVIHAPLLGGDEDGLDLASPEAIGELVHVNLKGHSLEGERAPADCFYQKNGKFYPATIVRVWAGKPKDDDAENDNEGPDASAKGSPLTDSPGDSTSPKPHDQDRDAGARGSASSAPADSGQKSIVTPTKQHTPRQVGDLTFGGNTPLMCEVKWEDGDVRYREIPYTPEKIHFTAHYTNDSWHRGVLISQKKVPVVKAIASAKDDTDNAVASDTDLANMEQIPSEEVCATVQVADFPGTLIRDVRVADATRIKAMKPMICQLYFVHRRLEPLRHFFLYSHSPKLFGTPFMMRLACEGLTTKDLYDHVLAHVRRFCPNWVAPDLHSASLEPDAGTVPVTTDSEPNHNVTTANASTTSAATTTTSTTSPVQFSRSSRYQSSGNTHRQHYHNTNNREEGQWTGAWVLAPPGTAATAAATHNNRQHKKYAPMPTARPKPYWGEFESALSQYPFRLSQVTSQGSACSVCDWLDGSSGALIPPDNRLLMHCLPNNETVAIDWDPNLFEEGGTYSLREANRVRQHRSIAEHQQEQTKPTDLISCLEKFTGAEKLTAYCSKCTKANDGEFTETEQEKKMGCWALPPLLVVQLKRFKTVQRHGYPKNSPASTYSYKLCNVIDIPEHLDLSSFVSPDAHADGDTSPQDCPKMLREEEVAKLEEDLRKLEAGGFEGDPKGASDVEKRRKQREQALEIDRMVEASRPTLSRKKVQYELFAVCHHTGSIKAGHYYAYIKGEKGSGDGDEKAKKAKNGGSHGEDQRDSETDESAAAAVGSPSQDELEEIWRLCNDQRVSDAKFKDVSAQGAYLLYYQRSDLKDIHVSKLYPPYFKEPPYPNMVEHVKKEKWNAPARPEDGEGTNRKKARGDGRDSHSDGSRGLHWSCVVQ